MAITRFEAAPVIVPLGIRLPTRETRRVPVPAVSSSVSAAAAKVSSRPNGWILRRGILGYVVDGLLGLGSNAALGHGGAGQGPLPLTGSDFSFYDVSPSFAGSNSVSVFCTSRRRLARWPAWFGELTLRRCGLGRSCGRP